MQNASKVIDLIRTAYLIVASAGPSGKPSGHLYAEMMGSFENINQYESMVALMVRTKLLTKRGLLLVAARI